MVVTPVRVSVVDNSDKHPSVAFVSGDSVTVNCNEGFGGPTTFGCNSLITGNVCDDAKYEGVLGLLFELPSPVSRILNS